MSSPAFDVDHVRVLRARTHDAIVDLADVRSHDPAASSAMHAVQLTIHTLQNFWVPALELLLEADEAN